ncbi:hypothetical protein MPSEU_000339200 [Mayamaea pseudoterrestris]|nr:hypothetical protein MPSEU_000339200 [Mayamaea pseudoterrestris]
MPVLNMMCLVGQPMEEGVAAMQRSGQHLLQDLDRGTKRQQHRQLARQEWRSKKQSTRVAPPSTTDSATDSADSKSASHESSTIQMLRSVRGKGTTNSNKPIEVLIAKTLGPLDVDETLLDILAMQSKRSTVVRWRLFCWSRKAFDSLHFKLDGRLDELNVEIILKEKVLKTYFWYNHLTEDSLPSSVDYVWLLDGDIVIRHMAWDCYWNILRKHNPAINQPSLIDNPQREAHNFWKAVSHPSACVNDAKFQKLVGIETSFIEQQAPMFRKDAWLAVRSVLDAGIGMWNHSQTTWGIDNVWCGIVQNELHNVTFEALQAEGLPVPYTGLDNCQVEQVEPDKKRPIGCMIVQATPVVHIDTNAYDDESRKRQNAGLDQQRLYKSTFPQYFRYPCADIVNNRQCQRNRIGFHRSLWMNEPCQKCRHWQCTPYAAIA